MSCPVLFSRTLANVARLGPTLPDEQDNDNILTFLATILHTVLRPAQDEQRERRCSFAQSVIAALGQPAPAG